MSKSDILICQIADPEVYLPCKVDVDGLRCERLERHSDDHWLGEHTILHRIAGSSKTCAQVNGEEPDTKFTAKPAAAKTRRPLGRVGIVLLTSAGVATAIVLAMLVQFGLPNLGSPTAYVGSEGPIQAMNTDLVAYTGQAIKSANVKQKALGVDGEALESPAFVFSNGEESENRKDLHLYVDFGDRESRDLILINSPMLKSLVQNGKVNLYLHAVPNGEAYSIYGPETVAEAFYYSPASAWRTLTSVLAFAEEYQANRYGTKKLAERLAEVAEESGVEQGNIDAASIQNGTFSSWLLSVAADPRLGMGTQVPSAYLGDRPLDLTSLDLTTNRDLLKGLEP